jgi:hypothetical protein
VIRKNTQTVWIVFAVLLAVLLLWQRAPQLFGAGEETPTTPPLSPTVLEITLADIAGLKISSADGEAVSFRLTDTGEWEQFEPDLIPAEKIDQFTLNQTLNQMFGWRELTSIDPITELDTVGLSAPAYRITFTLQNGETLRLDVGEKTVTDSGYYIRVEGHLPQIVRLFSVDPVLELLTGPPLLPTPVPTIATETTPGTPESGAGSTPEATSEP